MRLIDKVTVKGSIEPMELYTFDVEFSKIKVNHRQVDLSTLPKVEKKRFKVVNRLKRNDLMKRVLEDRF